MYGDFLLSATCMLAGPHGIKLASFLSLILCKLLCTCVGSTCITIQLAEAKKVFITYILTIKVIYYMFNILYVWIIDSKRRYRVESLNRSKSSSECF